MRSASARSGWRAAAPRALAVCLAAAALALAPAAEGGAGWRLDGEREGVAVWVADTPGSAVPTVMAVAEIPAAPEAVLRFVRGPGMRFTGLKELATVGRCGADCEYVYFRMGNWAITDRHYVVRMEWRAIAADGGTRYEGAWSFPRDRQPPADAGAIGIRGTSGRWIIAPADGGRATRATYVNHLDLGGSVPAGLYSLGFVRHAYDVLDAVRRGAVGS